MARKGLASRSNKDSLVQHCFYFSPSIRGGALQHLVELVSALGSNDESTSTSTVGPWRMLPPFQEHTDHGLVSSCQDQRLAILAVGPRGVLLPPEQAAGLNQRGLFSCPDKSLAIQTVRSRCFRRADLTRASLSMRWLAQPAARKSAISGPCTVCRTAAMCSGHAVVPPTVALTCDVLFDLESLTSIRLARG